MGCYRIFVSYIPPCYCFLLNDSHLHQLVIVFPCTFWCLLWVTRKFMMTFMIWFVKMPNYHLHVLLNMSWTTFWSHETQNGAMYSTMQWNTYIFHERSAHSPEWWHSILFSLGVIYFDRRCFIANKEYIDHFTFKGGSYLFTMNLWI